MESVPFSTIGFLNDQWPLTQTNWAAYFSPTIQDGIIAGIGDELQVFASSSGMYAQAKTGECRVRSHRGELTQQISVDIAAADVTYPRIDLVVARVTYGSPASMVITTKQGTPAADPVAPAVTQVSGSVWEIPLAEVTVGAGVVTIAPDAVRDRRFVYQTGGSAAIAFSGTALTVANDWEYRNDTEIDSLTITLPDSPSATFICSVCFSASAAFTGVTFTRGGEAYAVKTTDMLNNVSARYNLSIWWDGAYFWCAAKSA